MPIGLTVFVAGIRQPLTVDYKFVAIATRLKLRGNFPARFDLQLALSTSDPSSLRAAFTPLKAVSSIVPTIKITDELDLLCLLKAFDTEGLAGHIFKRERKAALDGFCTCIQRL